MWRLHASVFVLLVSLTSFAQLSRSLRCSISSPLHLSRHKASSPSSPMKSAYTNRLGYSSDIKTRALYSTESDQEEDDSNDFGFEIIAPSTSKKTTTPSSSDPINPTITNTFNIKKLGLAMGSLALGGILAVYQHAASPASGLGLLRRMEAESPPITQVACNNKPTVIEFYADWCDICKKNAAMVRGIEYKYRDQVNFITLNAIKPENDPWVRSFGVDGIPHYAFVDDSHIVQASLVGAVPSSILDAQVQALASHQPLPYMDASDSSASANDNNNDGNSYKLKFSDKACQL